MGNFGVLFALSPRQEVMFLVAIICLFIWLFVITPDVKILIIFWAQKMSKSFRNTLVGGMHFLRVLSKLLYTAFTESK